METSKKSARGTKHERAKKATVAKKVASKTKVNEKASKRVEVPHDRRQRAHALDVSEFERLAAKGSGEMVTLGVPLSVFLDEAVDCAKLSREHWQPVIRNGKVQLPGLKSAVKPKQTQRFDEHLADEILTLHELVQQAQTAFLLATTPTENAREKLRRADELLDQWTSALEWLFDDGVEDERDAQLAAVRSAHVDGGDRIDVKAAMLRDFGALAEKYVDELEGLLDFDRETLDEGRKLAFELRSSIKVVSLSPEARAAQARRNNLLALLNDRVRTVRKAARLVFRRFPEIARKFTSAYQRRTRALARREQEVRGDERDE
jgi:hypothetical protein